MLIKKNEVASRVWWALTKTGGRFLKEKLPADKANEVKYLVLQGQKKYQDNVTHASVWKDFFEVYDANGYACGLLENGVTGIVNRYDKSKKELTCFVTDLQGKGRPVSFSGDISSVEKCIRYMHELSKSSSRGEYLMEEQRQTIQRQKNEIRLLKLEIAELKSTLASSLKEETNK